MTDIIDNLLRIVTTGSIWKGSPTITARLERQIAPAAACGTACPASSTNSKGIVPVFIWLNMRWIDANVEETTGTISQNVFHIACISLSVRSPPVLRKLKKPSSVVFMRLDVALARSINNSFTFIASMNNSDCNCLSLFEYQGEISCTSFDSICFQNEASA